MILHLGILISGRGSNMESILKMIQKKNIPIKPELVISNVPDAKGLKIAQRLGVPTLVIPSKGFKGSRKQYDSQIISALKRHNITPRNGLVCLAGFMRIVGPEFVEKYKRRILNIHPALLPSFPGLDAQRQALEYGVKYTGCTVHFVDKGVDTGPIVLQGIVKVLNHDTAESLSKRILSKEHKIYCKAVEMFANDQISLLPKK